MKPQKVEISYRTIIFFILFVISLFIVWRLRSLILLVYLCFLFMEGLNPLVNWLQKFKIPRIISIILVYALIGSALSFSVAGIIPTLVEQLTNLIQSLPTLVENINLWGFNTIDFSSQLKILENLPNNVASTALSIFSNVISIFIFFVITFYLLLERNNLDKHLVNIFGSKNKSKALKISEHLEKRLGSWVGAELMLMFIIGILSYFGYALIGLNYALPLAIIAGLLEMIPNIGPTIASILAGLVGLIVSPLTALLAVVWGIIVQQLENNFIVPKIMKETVGINPLITILLIASGAELGGVVGAVIAVPVYLTIETVFRVLQETKK
ncbi:AI-2E family transporter [Candidatus Shapirobacteria bacterium]|nr:AI-2E family transporter [Candidatus Shapirobacteria bacterium]